MSEPSTIQAQHILPTEIFEKYKAELKALLGDDFEKKIFAAEGNKILLTTDADLAARLKTVEA